MFRFQAFHMFGVIGSAVAVGSLSVFLMKRTHARSRSGDPINFLIDGTDRVGAEHVLGGTIFGVGWGLVGACPGPLYALIGAGYSVMLVALLAAMSGAWAYGLLRSRLPHGPRGSGSDPGLELAIWRGPDNASHID